MANSLRIMAEEVRRLLAGGNPTDDFEIEEEELILALGHQRDKMVRIYMFDNMKMGEKAPDQSLFSEFGQDGDLLPEKDKARNLFYVDLPAVPVDLPYDKGVWLVTPLDNHFENYKRLPNGGQSLYKDIMGQDIWFEVQGSRLWLWNLKSDDCPLLVRMIAKTGSLDPDADTPSSAAMEADMVSAVFQLYAASLQIPIDIRNDANDSAGNPER